MDIQDRVVVVTGAASGIGKALAEAFHAAGASKVVCADLNEAGAKATAEALGGVGRGLDVRDEAAIKALIDHVEAEIGPIGIFCSNAGIIHDGGLEVANEAWQAEWEVHVMAHLFAARHVAPLMAERGEGWLLNTASAAGLLSHTGSAVYAVTKHAAVGLAEWISIAWKDRGVGVSVLCPQAVVSGMTAGRGGGVASVDGMMEAAPVAEACLQTIRDERFLVLPHPEVLDYMRNKTGDYDRWLGGMRKLWRKFSAA
ncbi:MAG: SDR family NAD(P)-dependent oxidoreductase [Pseudomonadota bacterium]